MNPPRKPWENANTNYRNSGRELPQDISGIRGSSFAQGDGSVNPPPVPNRPNQINSSYQSPFSSGYGSMFGNPYSNHLYGSLGMGYPSYGGGMYPNGGFTNSFASGLENYTQPTFQSAQSIIQAFSSVSMMLESTLFAVQNSVRAIVSVADQFSRLRLHLSASLLAILRNIRYYFRKLLILFRVNRPLSNETIWEELSNGYSSTQESRHWPIVLFFAVVLGTPWLMWKLLRLATSTASVNTQWHKGIGEHYLAEVKFPYTAVNEDEITVAPNEIVRLAPKHQQPHIRGWLLASNGDSTGLVPANYVKVLGKNRENTADKVHDAPKIQELENSDEGNVSNEKR